MGLVTVYLIITYNVPFRDATIPLGFTEKQRGRHSKASLTKNMNG
jgi:hypothetical protein